SIRKSSCRRSYGGVRRNIGPMFFPFGSLIYPVRNQLNLLLAQRVIVQRHSQTGIRMREPSKHFTVFAVSRNNGQFTRFRERFSLFFKKQAKTSRLFYTAMTGNAFGVNDGPNVLIVAYLIRLMRHPRSNTCYQNGRHNEKKRIFL